MSAAKFFVVHAFDAQRGEWSIRGIFTREEDARAMCAEFADCAPDCRAMTFEQISQEIFEDRVQQLAAVIKAAERLVALIDRT